MFRQFHILFTKSIINFSVRTCKIRYDKSSFQTQTIRIEKNSVVGKILTKDAHPLANAYFLGEKKKIEIPTSAVFHEIFLLQIFPKDAKKNSFAPENLENGTQEQCEANKLKNFRVHKIGPMGLSHFLHFLSNSRLFDKCTIQ